MLRSSLVTGGLLLLGLALAGETPAARGQEPIQTGTLLEARIERLPDGPVCWDIRRGSLAPGAKSPATGFHVHGWVVAYVTGGIERVTYEGGASTTLEADRAGLFAAGSPHVHESIGTVPRTNIGFEMSCERLPNSQGNSGTLPGIRSGPVVYQVQLRERVWPPGSQTPVHILSGPTTTFVLEGTIARSTSAGLQESGSGTVYVSPVGELAQNTNVGSTPARTLDLDVWPVGDTRSVAQPPEVRLPSPFARAMPRAGDAGLATEATGAQFIDAVSILAGLCLVGIGAAAIRRFKKRLTEPKPG